MYLNAPATKLLASKCACCARALVDAVSIETGIGPICREKHGYDAPDMDADWAAVQVALGADFAVEAGDDRDHHALANRLVHHVAAEQTGGKVAAYTAAIRALGYTTLADRITERLVGRRHAGSVAAPTGPAIEMTQAGGMIWVKSPYNEAAVGHLRAVPGRKWDGSANRFPASSEAAVLFALRLGYAGEDAILTTGEVVTLQAVQPGEQAPTVAKPIPVVTVEVEGNTMIVRAPYSPEGTEGSAVSLADDGTGWQRPTGSRCRRSCWYRQRSSAATRARS